MTNRPDSLTVHGIARREEPACGCPDRVGLGPWIMHGCPVHSIAVSARQVPAAVAAGIRIVPRLRSVRRRRPACSLCGRTGHYRSTCERRST